MKFFQIAVPPAFLRITCLLDVQEFAKILAFYLMRKISQISQGMAHDFTIRFTMKTVNGFEPLCDFYLGNNPASALSVFSQLEGNEEVAESDILHIDLIEEKDGLPVDIKIKQCTLTELGRSCCFIAKELFKYRNLEPGG